MSILIKGIDMPKEGEMHLIISKNGIVCGADALVVEGGSLDGGYFKFCPNCGVPLEEER